ncbi:MAG: hypothetical protein LBJ62_00625 [Bifidobacteriaceae bacterium]|nr:hypothetical protein [Bifidobacteriaceae bacterium]
MPVDTSAPCAAGLDASLIPDDPRRELRGARHRRLSAANIISTRDGRGLIAVSIISV